MNHRKGNWIAKDAERRRRLCSPEISLEGIMGGNANAPFNTGIGELPTPLFCQASGDTFCLVSFLRHCAALTG